MEHEDLMRSMEASADEKHKEIIDKARAKAANMMEEASARAEGIRRQKMAAAERAAMVEKNYRLFAAKSEMMREVSALKYGSYDSAFEEAAGELSMIRKSDGYPACFKKLVEEALGELQESEASLHIDPRDGELCEKVLSELGRHCKISTDISCAGGLNASTMDGKVVIFNTIESRLDRAREGMKLEIFKALYGD